MGFISKVYPNMQWNETTSQRKMLVDVREWLHNNHPTWSRAMVYLDHFKGNITHSDKIMIERGQMI
ncbi:MAG: hypothetical protein IK100_09565 [Muribaculaceae bacterium]|nr:hypothetical protein [Muribaculaceae bacterium]